MIYLIGENFVGEKWIWPSDEYFSPTKIFPDEVFPRRITFPDENFPNEDKDTDDENVDFEVDFEVVSFEPECPQDANKDEQSDNNEQETNEKKIEFKENMELDVFKEWNKYRCNTTKIFPNKNFPIRYWFLPGTSFLGDSIWYL